ncbi:MAG: hypothetical protein AB1352_00990 [Patescibacteria group bacterium]
MVKHIKQNYKRWIYFFSMIFVLNIGVVSIVYASVGTRAAKMVVGGKVTAIVPAPCPAPLPLVCSDLIVTLQGPRGKQMLLKGPTRPPIIGIVRKRGSIIGFGVSIGPYIQGTGLMFAVP